MQASGWIGSLPEPVEPKARHARYTAMAVMATASAVRSSVQAGPSDPWLQSSRIWARRRDRVLGEPAEINRFTHVHSSGSGSTGKRLWDMEGSRQQGRTKIAAGPCTGGPPIRVAPCNGQEVGLPGSMSNQLMVQDAHRDTFPDSLSLVVNHQVED